MKTRKVATKLSEQGRRALAEFLANNLSDRNLLYLFSEWECDVTFDINDNQAGHLEIGQHHSRTRNPVVRVFDGDEVEFEDVEVEGDED